MKNEGKAFALLFGFVFFAGIFLGGFNYLIDCANQLHSFKPESQEAIVARGILNGESVYFPTHPNERKCKQELIKQMPEKVDTVAIGASLLMTVNKEMLNLPADEFYNLGASGMNLKDYMNTLGMMKYYGKDADNFIFLLHIDVFLPNVDARNETYAMFGDYYRNHLESANIEKKDFDKISLSDVRSFIRTLFSVNYLKDNLSFIKKHEVSERFIVGGEHPEYAHYMNDGSWSYGEIYQKNSVREVLEDVRNRGKEYMPTINCEQANFILFDKIIQHLLSKGKEITLYFPPYCPSLYAAYPIENSPCFKEIEEFISQYDVEENITILGSFYPEKLGMTDENFYDARHVRREDMTMAFRKCE